MGPVARRTRGGRSGRTVADRGSGRLPAEKRKAQLLDAAGRVFASHGYSGTTTAQLAKAAGITEPIIYRHFKGKRELFIALVEKTGQDTVHEWDQAMRDAADPAERLTRLISANPMVAGKARMPYRVIVQAMMEVEDAGIREALHKHVQSLHSFLAREVEQAQSEGYVSKRFSPEITAWVLIEIALGYGVLSAAHVPSHGVDKTGLNVQDLLGSLMLGERYRRNTN